MSSEKFWAEARKADINKVRDKWWKRLAHIRNGKIGDGVHVAYEWMGGELIRAYIGHEAIGPCLQYDVSGKAYSGNLRVDMRGHWYNIYSRGNYGRKYACGGNWSSQHKSLHPRLDKYTRSIPEVSLEVTADGHIITREEMDGSPYWAIAHKSAAVSFADRLTAQEIQDSSLPDITKKHLTEKQTDKVIGCIRDIIEAYAL